MNRTWGIFAIGLVVGAAITGLVVVLATGGGGKSRGLEKEVASLREETGRLERELEAARADADRAREAASAAQAMPAPRPAGEPEEPARIVPSPEPEPAPEPTEPPPDASPVSDEELKKTIGEFANSFQSLLLGSDKKAHELAVALAKRDPTVVARAIERYAAEEGLGPKTILAHFLAQTGDPRAIDALKAVVRDVDAGFVDRRTASHGLAFVDDPALLPFLREVGQDTTLERGARANASFGVARQADDGIELYGATVDEAFREKDALAVAYLQGFMLLGERANAAVEKRLGTIKEKQARLLMVNLLAENGTADSIPALRRLAADPEASEDVRQAAEKAAAKLASDD